MLYASLQLPSQSSLYLSWNIRPVSMEKVECFHCKSHLLRHSWALWFWQEIPYILTETVHFHKRIFLVHFHRNLWKLPPAAMGAEVERRCRILSWLSCWFSARISVINFIFPCLDYSSSNIVMPISAIHNMPWNPCMQTSI